MIHSSCLNIPERIYLPTLQIETITLIPPDAFWYYPNYLLHVFIVQLYQTVTTNVGNGRKAKTADLSQTAKSNPTTPTNDHASRKKEWATGHVDRVASGLGVKLMAWVARRREDTGRERSSGKMSPLEWGMKSGPRIPPLPTAKLVSISALAGN